MTHRSIWVAMALVKRITGLDGWRGTAIISVLLAHFITNKGINFGRFGVELFFVLSGRLMAEMLFVRQVPLREFFPRRISRVYPVLFAFATIIFALSFVFDFIGVTLAQYVSLITFTANYAQFWTGKNPYIDQIWSLCIEEHIYMLLGMLALLHRYRPMPVALFTGTLAVLMMINGVIGTLMGGDYYDVYWRTDVRGASILISVALYLQFRKNIPTLLRGTWAPVVLGVVGCALNVNAVPDPIKYSLGTTLVAMSLILLSHAPAFVGTVLENRILVTAGLWSYSLYIWQQPFFSYGNAYGHKILMLPLAIIAGILSFKFIESPARTYLNRRWAARKTAVSAKTAAAE